MSNLCTLLLKAIIMETGAMISDHCDEFDYNDHNDGNDGTYQDNHVDWNGDDDIDVGLKTLCGDDDHGDGVIAKFDAELAT